MTSVTVSFNTDVILNCTEATRKGCETSTFKSPQLHHSTWVLRSHLNRRTLFGENWHKAHNPWALQTEAPLHMYNPHKPFLLRFLDTCQSALCCHSSFPERDLSSSSHFSLGNLQIAAADMDAHQSRRSLLKVRDDHKVDFSDGK